MFSKGQKMDLLEPFRRLKSWWHHRHMAYRDILVYDLVRKRYVLNRNTIEQNQVVPDDLKIDGEKYRYFKTQIAMPEYSDTRIEDEDGVEVTYLNPTPITDKLYYDSDALNNASSGEFRNKILSPMVMAVLIGVAIVMFVMFFFMR